MTFEEWWDSCKENFVGYPNVTPEELLKMTADAAWDAALHNRANPTKCACGEPVMKPIKGWRPFKWCQHCMPGPF